MLFPLPTMNTRFIRHRSSENRINTGGKIRCKKIIQKSLAEKQVTFPLKTKKRNKRLRSSCEKIPRPIHPESQVAHRGLGVGDAQIVRHEPPPGASAPQALHLAEPRRHFRSVTVRTVRRNSQHQQRGPPTLQNQSLVRRPSTFRCKHFSRTAARNRRERSNESEACTSVERRPIALPQLDESRLG